MGFYYGSNTPPEDKPGGFRETIVLIWAVFLVLAVPLGILLGGLAYLVLVFFLFSVHPLAGLAAISLVILALVARGVWEARHPPEIL